MSQSFAIRHTFNNIMSMKVNETIHGPVEYYYNIPWKIRISRENGFLIIYLDCMVSTNHREWYIDTSTSGKIIQNLEETQHSNFSISFNKNNTFSHYFTLCFWDPIDFVYNGNFTYEFSVTIEKSVGLDLVEKLKMFDNDSAKEDSDVTLIVKDKKFYVLKKYLAHHSTYFKSLFSGNFSEAEKSEIELKDIEPEEFQHFLELIYGESLIQDFSVPEILHLADFFDSKTAIRRCHDFLIEKSGKSLKEKLHMAVKYNLDKLKEKCLSEIKTIADVLSIVPEDPSQFEASLWKELLVKSSSLGF